MPSSDRLGTNVPDVVSQAERPSQREQRSEAPTKQPGPCKADSEVIPSLKPGIEIAHSNDCLPFLDLNTRKPEDQPLITLVMRAFSIALVTATGLLAASIAVEAKTTRSFSGSSPAEVEKNARKAGYSYPDGDMNCSSRCNQRWVKD